MNISGSIVELMDEQQVTDTFKKREFVVEFAENPQYPEYVKFELIQDKCALLDAHKVGDKVVVHFNLKGRKWTDKEGQVKYFNSLQAWRLDAEGENQASATDMAPLDGLSEPGWIADDKEDDLPF
ncbi:MAG: DUF3127 domain-containing protein [Cyclobacteriaceae bacterium]|nr:DUF3127 domain-containing protein [Cyclobacteriaceae bacterium]